MTGDNVQGLETLEAWKKARELAVFVIQEVLPKLPTDEKWNLNQQIRRAVSSVPANIAEGHGRFYYQENVRFCYIARGSLLETYSHLVLAHDLKYISDELFTRLKQQIEALVRIIKRLHCLLETLQTRRKRTRRSRQYSRTRNQLFH